MAMDQNIDLGELEIPRDNNGRINYCLLFEENIELFIGVKVMFKVLRDLYSQNPIAMESFPGSIFRHLPNSYYNKYINKNYDFTGEKNRCGASNFWYDSFYHAINSMIGVQYKDEVKTSKKE